MKIQGDESAVNVNSVVKNLQKNETGRNVQKKHAGSEDDVQLSPRAKEFQRIKDVLAGVPENREEKIAALKESIEKGTYNPDTGKAAEKMIRESLLDLFI